MSFEDRKEKFYNRFGVEDNISQNAAFGFFRNGIKNYLADIDARIEEEDARHFCSLFGYEFKWSYNSIRQKYSVNIFECITLEGDWIKYLHKIQELFYWRISYNSHASYNNLLFHKIKELMSNSKLSIDIIKSNGEYIIYPVGSAFLDNELVVNTLKFLNLPSHHHFISGLKFYANKNKDDYIHAAESMRRALEEFLRFVFTNEKGLKENIILVGKTLKELQKQNEIKSIFHNFMDYLDKFYNDNSKHKDGEIGEAECELIILQTGLLLKYLDNIKLQIQNVQVEASSD